VCVLENLFHICWWILLSLPQHHLETTSVAAVAESFCISTSHSHFWIYFTLNLCCHHIEHEVLIISLLHWRLLYPFLLDLWWENIISSIHCTSDHITSRNNERDCMPVVFWYDKLFRSTSEFKNHSG
jgi:hypothetical protein